LSLFLNFWVKAKTVLEGHLAQEEPLYNKGSKNVSRKPPG
jgi:hypothetical protein